MINLVEFLPFLTPIPAMAIFHFHTDRFNKLTVPFIAGMLSLSAILFITDTTIFNIYTPILIFNYALMLSLGLYLFRLRHDFFQSLSVAYCLLFVNVFFWETPIYIYTFLKTGQFAWYSQLAPLALFPATHVYKHIGTLGFKKTVPWLLIGFVVSTIFLIPIITNNWTIWVSETIEPNFPSDTVNTLWFFNRVICYLVLVKVFLQVYQVKYKNLNILN